MPVVFFKRIFPLIYAAVLASLPLEGFVDRDSYLEYINSSLVIIVGNFSRGWVYLLSNEPVWLLINVLVGFLFEPSVALKVIIFFSAFLFSTSIMRLGLRDTRLLLFAALICLLPQVLKNYVIHLRQGVGIAFFMFAATLSLPATRRFFWSISAVIHTSFVYLLLNLILSWGVKKYSIYIKNKHLMLLYGVSILFGFIFLYLISYSGARQAEEIASIQLESRSGIAFLFWILILIIYISNGLNYCKINSFAIFSIISYLSLYFLFSPIARIFESALPLVLFSGYSLKKSRQQLFFLLFGILFSYQWIIPLINGVSVFRLA